MLLHRVAFSQRSLYHRSFDTEKTSTQSSFHTEGFLQRGAFTQRSSEAKQLLYTETLVQGHFCTRKLLHKKTLHRGAFAHRSWYAKRLLYFMCRNFYTQKNFYTPGTFTRRLHRLLHQKLLQYTENFTCRNFYTQKPLHTEECLRTGAFTQRRVHTHRIVFTHRNFYTEKYLHIFYRLSYFRIIHDLLSSYLGAHALLVNSLLLFFRGTPSLSFHVAPCSVHPRCPRSPCGESN